MIKRKNFFYSLIAAPGILFVFVTFGYLLYRVFYMSFLKVDILVGEYEFLGLKNYIDALKDKNFLLAIFRNYVYTIVVVFFSFIIGMVEALVINSNFRLNSVVKILFIIPMLFMPSAAGVVWIMLYSGNFGWINHLIHILGGKGIAFLSSPNLAFWSVVITDIWGWSPFLFLILLAGLKSLPKEPFEAAAVDGASKTQLFFYITMPLMKPIIIIGLILKAIDTFRSFNYMWVMTQGGPGNSSQILSTIIYRSAYRMLSYGPGSAMSIITLIASLVLTIFFILYYYRIERD